MSFLCIGMSLYIASLNSGSNGNCYYIGNGTEAILVDAGISCRETERRMELLGLSLETVCALFISHEHSDHIKGVAVLSRKYNIPVYISPGTLTNSQLKLEPGLIRTLDVNSTMVIKGFTIVSFSKVHDAAEPCSFTVEGNGVTIGIFTDLGLVCDNLIHHFRQCNAAFLESNYDEEMLENGSYPFHLKKRIRGGKGHLSNRQALELFRKYRPVQMTHLLLSHLSRENNCPELTSALFSAHAATVKIIVASREMHTELYPVVPFGQAIIKPLRQKDLQMKQLNLF